jgi:hypothetical protein
MNAYEYNKNDEMRKMLRTAATLEPMVLQMSGLCFITQEGITMSNCKTCNQAISWDQKKREALKIRGPCNPDGSVHQCMKKEQVTKVTADLDLKEQGLSKSIQELTSTINILISLMSASTEAERNQIKRQLVV